MSQPIQFQHPEIELTPARWHLDQEALVPPLLLSLAVQLCLDVKQSVSGYALIVDAKGADAKDLFRRHGFRLFQDSPRILYLPLVG